jgi:hypothetical protein
MNTKQLIQKSAILVNANYCQRTEMAIHHELCRRGLYRLNKKIKEGSKVRLNYCTDWLEVKKIEEKMIWLDGYSSGFYANGVAQFTNNQDKAKFKLSIKELYYLK